MNTLGHSEHLSSCSPTRRPALYASTLSGFRPRHSGLAFDP